MDSTDPTEMHDPVDRTQLVAPPAEPRGRNTRPLLIGLIAAFSLGIVGVAIAAASGSDGGGEGTQLVTATSTATTADEAVALTSSVTATGPAIEVTTTAAVGREQPQPADPAPTGGATQAAAPTSDSPTIPPGHVDSCAYPNMPPTVVSGTTYTPAPTPTVTAVTSPDRCPPYSAGYPWDGS